MKIYLKIFIITILFFVISLSHVNAVDMFLTNSNIIVNENNIENIAEGDDIYDSQLLSTPTNPTPTVTHQSSTSSTDTTLSISDIIDVILIAVCIVLIFLAIAILIRCK